MFFKKTCLRSRETDRDLPGAASLPSKACNNPGLGQDKAGSQELHAGLLLSQVEEAPAMELSPPAFRRSVFIGSWSQEPEKGLKSRHSSGIPAS